MSDNLPQALPAPTTDLTPADQDLVTKFIADGMPGLAAIDAVKLGLLFNLYLEGKTYRNIASSMRVTKALVLYLSDRYDWYKRKRERQDELMASILDREIEAKLDSLDFIITAQQHYFKVWRKKMAKYDEYEDENVAKDLKDITKVLKTIETLYKLTSDVKGLRKKKNVDQPSAPLVGINIPEGATIARNDDGSVDISPKEKAQVDMLTQLSNMRREQEALKSKKRSDIEEIVPQENNPVTEPQGDKVNGND